MVNLQDEGQLHTNSFVNLLMFENTYLCSQFLTCGIHMQNPIGTGAQNKRSSSSKKCYVWKKIASFES